MILRNQANGSCDARNEVFHNFNFDSFFMMQFTFRIKFYKKNESFINILFEKTVLNY